MKDLDAYLPTFEFSERHAVAAKGDAAALDAALRSVTFAEVPIVRALVFLRGIGSRAKDERIIDSMARRSKVLEDVPGEGLVLSTRGQFWRLRGRGPEEPATAVVDFRAAEGRLTTETRVHVADPAARRKFARYWRAIQPFSGLTRILLLRAAKRRAETGA